MVHQIYVGNYEFNSIVNGETSAIVHTFVHDLAVIEGDYVIFINREKKKRTIVRVTDSEKKNRNITTEMLGISSNDSLSFFNKLYTNYEENMRTSIPYKISFEESEFQIEFPIEEENKISEIIFIAVSDDGIGLCRDGQSYKFYTVKVEDECELEKAEKKAVAFFGLNDTEVIIPLMRYSMINNHKEIFGQFFLVQPDMMYDTEEAVLVRPNFKTSTLSDNCGRTMLAETMEFTLEKDRYIFWILEMLFSNDDIPEKELGFIDEPETIADILLNRIKCLHDMIYLDYDNFIGDNFRIYVEPNLTVSQCFERVVKLAMTEENYQEIMNELIYNPAFARWALDYDRERTLHDTRYINEWLV